MAFKIEKLRPDWKVKNFVIPISSISLPEEFWQEAKTYKESWNKLVETYRSFDNQLDPLTEKYQELKKAKESLTEIKAEMSEVTKNRREAVNQVCKQQSEALFNNDYENLQQSLQTALGLAFKTRGTLHYKRLDKINFCKRYGNGGTKFAQLFTEKNTQTKPRSPFILRLGEKWESNKSRFRQPLFGKMLVGKRRIPVNFCGTWTYPTMLENDFIKKVSLTGSRDRLGNWQWQIVIAVETEPIQEIYAENRPVCAIDLGFRKFEDYIRFGFIVDSTGRKFELRLPHTGFINADLKRTLKLKAKFSDWREKEYIKSLEDYFVWESAQGSHFQSTKNKVEALTKKCVELEADNELAEWKICLAGFSKMRQTGFKKILRYSKLALAEQVNTPSIKSLLEEIITLIEKQIEADNYYLREKDFFRQKFSGRRDIYFRQVSKWLSQSYAQVAWEEKLQLSSLASKTKQLSRNTDAPLIEAAKWRQWTGLYKFRQFMKERDSSPNEQWILDGQMDYSTQICDICGEKSDRKGADLILVCPNGHERDQDHRAGKNMLNWTFGDSPKKNVSIPQIPKHLSHIIVPTI